MSAIVQSYYPNRVEAHPASPGTTNWKYVGIDPTTRNLTFYDTLAAVKAAGDFTYPGLDGGGKIGTCLIATKTDDGLVGSDLLYRLNSSVLPTGMDEATDAVTGGGQQISESTPFRNIAVSLVDGTDLLVLNGAY